MWATRNVWSHNSILWPQSFPLPGVPKMPEGILVIKTELLWGARFREIRMPKGPVFRVILCSPGFFLIRKICTTKDTHPNQDVGCEGRQEMGNGGSGEQESK